MMKAKGGGTIDRPRGIKFENMGLVNSKHHTLQAPHVTDYQPLSKVELSGLCYSIYCSIYYNCYGY